MSITEFLVRLTSESRDLTLMEERMERGGWGLKLQSGMMATLAMLAMALPLLTQAQAAGASYPAMSAIDQYRMPREAEIKLARTAAPESISRDAEILILGEHGFETAVKGKNGFVCTVQRGWAA